MLVWKTSIHTALDLASSQVYHLAHTFKEDKLLAKGRYTEARHHATCGLSTLEAKVRGSWMQDEPRVFSEF